MELFRQHHKTYYNCDILFYTSSRSLDISNDPYNEAVFDDHLYIFRENHIIKGLCINVESISGEVYLNYKKAEDLKDLTFDQDIKDQIELQEYVEKETKDKEYIESKHLIYY